MYLSGAPEEEEKKKRKMSRKKYEENGEEKDVEGLEPSGGGGREVGAKERISAGKVRQKMSRKGEKRKIRSKSKLRRNK